MHESDTDAAAAAVAPEAGQFASLDMAGFGESLMRVASKALSRPAEVGAAVGRFGLSLARIGSATTATWLGVPTALPLPVAADRRFDDPAWAANPMFAALRQCYLATGQLVSDMLAAGGGDATSDAKAGLAANFVLDALAPTNFLLTNPAALKQAFDTGGASVLRGARNLTDDVLHNRGMPRQVDKRPFELGVNLAATPGKVVYANELMELIQYAPQTELVHAVPLLASPPWINKYYVMDLAPGRSFLEWAVQHKRTVFAISYRNPDSSLRDVTLEDYLIAGPRQALDVVADITGATKIDIAGLCLGGALTAILAAYLAAVGDDRLGSVTLLNTMLDYSQPGILGAFTDERTVSRLERRMAAPGYLDGRQMAAAFDVIRANDLIFSYLVSGWLMGQDPPAFDILAWNADSTRMPAAMHSFYLRSFYLRNELANGELTLAGQRLSLADVKSDAYVVGAVNDHIVPWHASYQATRLLGGPVRYVLSSGGHVAGIVNPPGPKAWHETAGCYPAAAQDWRAGATRTDGSWWQDWAEWAAERAGSFGPPPAMGSRRFPIVRDAPGQYVRG